MHLTSSCFPQNPIPDGQKCLSFPLLAPKLSACAYLPNDSPILRLILPYRVALLCRARTTIDRLFFFSRYSFPQFVPFFRLRQFLSEFFFLSFYSRFCFTQTQSQRYTRASRREKSHTTSLSSFRLTARMSRRTVLKMSRSSSDLISTQYVEFNVFLSELSSSE